MNNMNKRRGKFAVKKRVAVLVAMLLVLQILSPALSLAEPVWAESSYEGSKTLKTESPEEQSVYQDLEETLREEGRNAEYSGYIVSVKDSLSPLQEWNVERSVVMEQGIESLDYAEGLYVADSVESIRETIKEDYIEEIVPNYIRHFTDMEYSSDAATAANAYTESDRTLAAVTPNDDFFKYQYYINTMNVSDIWEKGMEGQDLDATVDLNKNGNALDDPIIIAVIDSGLNTGHVDIDYSRVLKGRAFRTGFRDTVVSDDNIYDYIGHGTQIVAELIAKKNNNKEGLAGILQKVKILPLKVSENEGRFTGAEITDSSVIAAINYAIKQNASVINMSLGGNNHNPLLEEACRKAMDEGIIIVCAAGNYYEMGNMPGYPAQYTLGVGAVDSNNTVTYFSQRLSKENGMGWKNKVWVTAPGSDICTVTPNEARSYSMGEGTSYAAPLVSALAALCKSVHNNITEEEFKTLLKETSTYKKGSKTISDYKLDSKGNKQYQSVDYGWGIVNYKAALENIHIAGAVKTENKKAATCKTAGSYDEVTYCKTCNLEMSRKTVKTSKSAHTWDAGVVTKQPTSTTKGTIKYTCTVCKTTKTESIDFVPADFTSAKVSNVSASYSYTGKEIKPVPKVTLNGKTLKANTDYTLKYENNIKEGTASIYITGKGTYSGTVLKTFKIVHKHVYGDQWVKVDSKNHKKVCIYDSSHEKLQAHTWDKGKVVQESTKMTAGIKVYTCTACGAEKGEELPLLPSVSVERIYGENRYTTGFDIATAYMKEKGLTKLSGVIVACGTNFPDALAASYLSKSKNMPIIVWSEKQNLAVQNFIKKNVKTNGTIYLLGGPTIVGKSIANGMSNYRFIRIYDSDRYGTNINILKQAKLKGGEILVCNGTTFENALIGSATGKPILLVKNQGLNAAQKAYLNSLTNVSFTILGDRAMVSSQVQRDLQAISKNVTRIDIEECQKVSYEVAKKYFKNPKEVIFAIDNNYPDALCGGALAIAKGCPIMLINNTYYVPAFDYCASNKNLKKATVLGGPALISDKSANNVVNGDHSSPPIPYF